jgi:hypothetical protein
MKVVLLLLLALMTCPAYGQGRAPLIRFTHYDPSLGSLKIDQSGDISFSGKIRISGKLRVERSDPDLCGGFCAYLIPDTASQNKLPREILSSGATSVRSINLYDATPVLITVFGRKQTKKILHPKAQVLELPATLVLSNFRIYGACDAVHYEANVVSTTVRGPYVALNEGPTLGGC